MPTNAQLVCKENADSLGEETIRQPKVEIDNDAAGCCTRRVN